MDKCHCDAIAYEDATPYSTNALQNSGRLITATFTLRVRCLYVSNIRYSRTYMYSLLVCTNIGKVAQILAPQKGVDNSIIENVLGFPMPCHICDADVMQSINSSTCEYY